MQTCVFCDVWGSAANSESLNMDLLEQLQKYQNLIRKKYKAEKFLVYFQAYTNTFAQLPRLRQNFETALSFPGVVGFVVGTRPDCISQGVLNLWQEFHERSFVSVELGVQSFFDDQLEFMRRGHSSFDSIRAIQRIADKTSVDLGIHLMFGQPGETDEDMVLTAQILNQLPIQHVKLHNLHVLRNTPLEGFYKKGEFSPIEREIYARRVQLFLEHLRPEIFVQRLAAYSSRWDELIAPRWTADKMGTHQFLIDFIREHKSYQSKSFFCKSEEETRLRTRLQDQSLRSPQGRS